MRVLGIDPGLRLTGYGCIETAEAGRGRRRAGEEVRLIEAGVIRLKAGHSVAARLFELDTDLQGIIKRCDPTVLAVEKLYAHYEHPLTGVIMAHARGVVLLNAQRAGLTLIELAATQVKKSLTGNGHASKTQMQLGVQSQLALSEAPSPPDVADAIAIALCALRRA
jgi:crossover junction endodeoxyribonuclease RuvC